MTIFSLYSISRSTATITHVKNFYKCVLLIPCFFLTETEVWYRCLLTKHLNQPCVLDICKMAVLKAKSCPAWLQSVSSTIKPIQWRMVLLKFKTLALKHRCRSLKGLDRFISNNQFFFFTLTKTVQIDFIPDSFYHKSQCSLSKRNNWCIVSLRSISVNKPILVSWKYILFSQFTDI